MPLSPYGHENLSTEGQFEERWLDPVQNKHNGKRQWRFPYFIEFAGKRHDRVLEVSERVDLQSDIPSSLLFLGRLSTGPLVTVIAEGSGYSIHLLREQHSEAIQELSAVIIEAEQIAQAAAKNETFALA